MDVITESIQITRSERDRLVRWYAKMTELERIDVHSQQTYLLRANREILRKNLSQEAMTYAALCLALSRRFATLNSGNKKSNTTTEQAKRISAMRIDAVKGARKKKEGAIEKAIRIKWFPQILKLREEGLSWRDISDYLAKYHKKRVSHTYLAKIVKATEDNNKTLKDV